MKRNFGGGRLKSAHEGGLSRKCVVDGCKLELRSDNLREHYKNKVIWDKDGQPIPTYLQRF